MKKIFIYLLVVTCTLFTACSNSSQNDKIRVGVLMPLTGDIAFLGQSFTNAILMNVDTSKVELYIQDTQGEPKIAVSILTQMLATKKIDVVVSLKPAVSESINPILEAKSIPHFVFAFSPEITLANNVIKQYPSSDDEVLNYLAYAQKNNKRNVVFLRHMFPDAELAFKTIVEPESKKIGINVVDVPFDLSTRDFNNLAAKVKSYDPDLIVVQSLSYNFLNIVKSFYNAGILDKMLGDLNFGDLYTYDFTTVKEMDNIPFLGLSYVLTDQYKAFEEAYCKKYGEKPNIFAAYPYDVMTIINNMDNSGIDKQNIIRYYHENIVSGVTGRMWYDEQGDQIIEYEILKYNDGVFVQE